MSGLIKKTNLENDPNGVLLSENDVVSLRQYKIDTWSKLTDIWSLRYGIGITAGTTFLTNTSLNLFYRKCFFLDISKTFSSFISSSLMSSVLPSATTAAIIYSYYTLNLLRIAPSECLTCRELKSLGLQVTIGGLLPIFITWSANFLYADIYKTYGVPKTEYLLQSKYRAEYLRQVKLIWKRTNKNSASLILRSLAAQFFMTSFILFMQQKQFKDHIEPYSFTKNEIDMVKLKNFK